MKGGGNMDTQDTKPSAIQQIHSQLDMSIVTRGRMVFIGLGGVGMYVAKTAATFLAGLQRAMPNKEINLLLCDGDEFSFGNTYRMDVPEMGNKAEVLGREMLKRFDVPGFSVRWKAEYVKPENICDIIQEGDCVLLAVDNHATRKLVSDYCCENLNDFVIISGGNDGVDEGLRGTYGNVQVHVREDGVSKTAQLTRFHPEIKNPADKSPSEMDCLELEAAGVPQLAVVNLAVASAMLSSLMRLLMPVEGERMWDEISLDIIEGVNQPNWLSGPQEKEP